VWLHRGGCPSCNRSRLAPRCVSRRVVFHACFCFDNKALPRDLLYVWVYFGIACILQ
jgi:hypothetical protein